MGKRKYSKCEWCDKTIDITNNNNELCSDCARFRSSMERDAYYRKLEEE